MITDSQRLISAVNQFGSPIPVYDDGFGQLYIHRDSMGISGIVRAQSWEDAYSICEDEFFPEASETIEELRAEYNVRREHKKVVRCSDPQGEAGPYMRYVRDSDYINGRLPDGLFVRWETVETPCEDENGWTENELFCDAFGFRPNGPNERDTLRHGIYAKDLNGDYLDVLTPELAERLGITLTLEDEE